jgi:hypothetical protein
LARPVVLTLLLATVACVPAERSAGDRPAAKRAKLIAEPGSLLEPSTLASASPSAATDSTVPALEAPFVDDFERAALGDDYFATSPRYHIDRGRLCVKGARNHPLWLRRRLPVNARIEVEVEARSDEGDVKLEAWGDGRAAATGVSYTDATSYLAIFGGWKNHFHVLARLDEHAADRPEVVIQPGSDDPREQPVVSGRRYRLKLERSDGRTLRFWVDDVEVLSFADPRPLAGGGHDHFAFNNWQAPACFDHLVVAPLPS